MAALWNACEYYLNQACELIERLPQAQYDVSHSNCFGASIGGHIRHCAEHFESFRRGVQLGEIDYDDRARGTEDESDPLIANQRLCEMGRWFGENSSLKSDSDSVKVKVNCGESESGWQNSTVGRELQFLVSHTVHHFAIIGIMCETQGIPLAPGFGVAPSTLMHRLSEANSTVDSSKSA